MNRATIRLTSITYAIRAQKILAKRGIQAVVRKSARSMNTTGCSYGVEITAAYLAQAQDLLTGRGIQILDIQQ